MPKKIDDVQKQRAKSLYLEGKSPEAIGNTPGCPSAPTVRRLIKEENWENQRTLKSFVQKTVVSAPDLVGDLDSRRLLERAIADLEASIGSVPYRSGGEIISGIAKMLEIQHKLYPRNMDELADLAIATPNFSIQAFVDALKRKANAS